MAAPVPRISCKEIMTLIQDDKKLKKIFGKSFSTTYLEFLSDLKNKPNTSSDINNLIVLN